MWCLRQKNLMRAMVSVFEYTRDGDVPGVCVLQKDKNWYTNEKCMELNASPLGTLMGDKFT